MASCAPMQKTALALALLSAMACAQTTFSGTGKLKGTTTTSTALPKQFTHVYAYSPPLSGQNNANFLQYVMSQSAIDGVTVNVAWSSIETTPPTAGACVGGNSDTQQTDSIPYCHAYNWMMVDGTACHTGVTFNPGTGLGQFFCAINPNWNSAKYVNPIIVGITENPNSATPDYVFGSIWVMAVGATSQDVINNLKDSCGSYTGYTSPQISAAAMDSTGAVKVTMTGSMPFTSGDTIWVSGFDSTPQFNVTSQAGTQITSVTGLTFKYNPPCSPACATQNSINIGNIVSAQSSWPIPSETPYQIAFRTFVAAAIYHFSHSGTIISPSQVAYMRVGYARGGEALPECVASWPGYVSQAASRQNWLNFYADTSSYSMGASASSGLHMQTALNAAGTLPPDPSYGTAEAEIAVQYVGGDGKVFGFGSQGMQSNDITNYPNCASDWCNQFIQFWAGGPSYKNTEFELQQIDCSNPTGGGSVSDGCFQNGFPGKTGDLRALFLTPYLTSPLPFVLYNHTTIIELYSQDALLAYDPNFCNVSGGTCVNVAPGDWFGSDLSAATQYDFYTHVGQGATCSGGLGTGNGDCSYASAVNTVHGSH